MAGMVIVGAGECGTRAALALREAGYDGPVTLIGAEPHAALRAPAALQGRDHRRDRRRRRAIAGADRLAEAGIDFRPGRTAPPPSTAPRRVVRCADGERARLRAAAARHRRPAAPAAAPGRRRPGRRRCCAPSTTPPASAPPSAPAGASRSSAAASSASSSPPPPAGSAPRSPCIEALPRLLTRGVPAEIAAALQARHVAEGVTLPLRRRASPRITAGRRRARRRHAASPPTSSSSASARCPNTALAAAAGLAVDNGIAVDATPRHLRPGDLRRRRLLLVPAAALRRPPRPPRELAQRPGAGHAWPPATCSAPPSRSRRCPGSGRTSTT